MNAQLQLKNETLTPLRAADIQPGPKFETPLYRPAQKLAGKRALITGAESGIGRAVAVLYAREGADVAITFAADAEAEADITRRGVEAEGRRCLMLAGDLTSIDFCREAVVTTVNEFGALDILVSNAAHQMRVGSLEEMSFEDWDRTFKTNVYAYFHLVKFAVPHLPPGSAIIATSSETAFLGPKELPDCSATKGAINSLTKSLAQMLIEKGIRVNAVAPGPVWTPTHLSQFGARPPLGRAALPEQIAPAYVFLASDADSSYITGAILPETGGLPVQ